VSNEKDNLNLMRGADFSFVGDKLSVGGGGPGQSGYVMDRTGKHGFGQVWNLWEAICCQMQRLHRPGSVGFESPFDFLS
jgi:hypothetical protein